MSFARRGIRVASLIRLILSLCLPRRLLVFTPPSLTTIVFLCGAFAVRTATTRDQPPDSFAVTRTWAEPKVSTRERRRPLVRAALATPVSELLPPKVKWRRLVFGSAE